MGKMHEILAVERELENASNKIIEEAIITFTKKQEHFTGFMKVLQMFDDSRAKEEDGQREQKTLTTTVQEKLDYVAKSFIKSIDCLAQKEATNQHANADVIINGKAFLSNLPATFLLTLEQKLTFLRRLYDNIPTLDPGINWKEDPSEGPDVFVTSSPIIKHKTEKTIKAIELAKATDKHPAQIEKLSQDVPVGNYVTTQWSGKVTPARKSVLLSRIDTLIQEIKKARQRANTQEAININVGEIIMSYINA